MPAGDEVIVVLRDPVSRFVSGFNSRQRQGMPNHFNAWKPRERRAFERFDSADALATALSDADPERRAEAEEAMADIGHVRTRIGHWLGSPELIFERAEDFLLVGWVETLADDFERLRSLIGLPDDRQLPADPKVAHKAPQQQSWD